MDQFRTFVGPSTADNRLVSSTPVAPQTPAIPLSASPPPTTPTTATPSPVDPLTDKEERILDLLAQGKSNKQIAAEIFLAEGTVKNYVSRIMDKLHARSRLELAMHVNQRRT